MNKKYFANVVALGFGALTVSAQAEACLNLSNTVFDSQPRSIMLSICEEESLSLTDVSKMIAQRNHRDKKLVCSTGDKMTHL